MCQPLGGGHQPFIWPILSRHLHENKEISSQRGYASLERPRSATTYWLIEVGRGGGVKVVAQNSDVAVVDPGFLRQGTPTLKSWGVSPSIFTTFPLENWMTLKEIKRNVVALAMHSTRRNRTFSDLFFQNCAALN